MVSAEVKFPMANQVSNVSHTPRHDSQVTETSKPAKSTAAAPKPAAEDKVTISSAGKAANSANAAKAPKT
jgi:hypothetical protein